MLSCSPERKGGSANRNQTRPLEKAKWKTGNRGKRNPIKGGEPARAIRGKTGEAKAQAEANPT
ncbi:MAG: hypothetical protein DRI89_05075 [Bacteroidetes bacterium]|nr:MAG: hypothetical protein DRI89_05075 [Bacteroidota bacterium]